MKSHDELVDRTDSVVPKPRWILRCFVVMSILVVCGLVWFGVDHEETTRLARDTRVVVRCPDSFIERLMPDEIREQFPILVSVGKLEVTGRANVVGRVSIEIHPHADERRPDDAIILVRVTGDTQNELVGTQSQVQVIGDGSGNFEAINRVRFDGRTFIADEETIIEARHETRIVAIVSRTGTALQGTVRMLASRNARTMLPELNRLAETQIEEMVKERLDGLISDTVEELNQINRFDETVTRLHPNFERWRIAVSAEEGFVQAALVPEGGRLPTLPTAKPSTLEVWIRLTRTQRTGINLVAQWNQSHILFRDLVTEEHARRLAKDLTIADVEDWTCFRIGAPLRNPGAVQMTRSDVDQAHGTVSDPRSF